MKLREALLTLDQGNDEQWTADGLPRLEILSELVGIQVQRAAVSEIAKGFTRKNPVLAVSETASSIAPSEAGAPEMVSKPTQPTQEQVEETREETETELDRAALRLEKATNELREAQLQVNSATKNLNIISRKFGKSAKQLQNEQTLDIQKFQRQQAQQRRACKG